MTHRYQPLRNKLNDLTQELQQAEVERFLFDSEGKPIELQNGINGFSLEDLRIEEDAIYADVYCMVFGESALDEDGPHQDDDGDNFDIEETEYSFSVEITESGISWEKM